MTDTKPTAAQDVAAIAHFIEENIQPRVVSVIVPAFGEAGTVPVLLAPDGMKVIDLKPTIDALRGNPVRRRGIAQVNDMASFIAHSNRHKDAASVIFGEPVRSQPKLTTIFNYNTNGAEKFDAPLARFGDHRVVYAPATSDEYKAWSGQNGKKMSQVDFAQFIENRILDIVAPPSDGEEDDAHNIFMKDYAELLGGKFAGPSTMLELSRGIEIAANSRVKQIVRLATGEARIQYDEQHVDATGAPVTIPNMFLIAIPIFYNGPFYRLPVRLRYRLTGTTVEWFYELYRIDRSFDAAFNEMCETAKSVIGLPLFLGSPET